MDRYEYKIRKSGFKLIHQEIRENIIYQKYEKNRTNEEVEYYKGDSFIVFEEKKERGKWLIPLISQDYEKFLETLLEH